MESSSSNLEESKLQQMQLEERNLHKKCMAWYKELKSHLGTLRNICFSVVGNGRIENLHSCDPEICLDILRIQFKEFFNSKEVNASDFHNQCWQKRFKDYTGCEPETYRRKLLRYLDELEKLIDERVLKCGELRMKEREVKAIKEIEKWLKEREIQHQESLSTNCTSLDASLVNEGITLDASLVAKQSTVDSTTLLEQQNESNSSRNEWSKSGNKNRSFDNESSSSGYNAIDVENILVDTVAYDIEYVDIRPSYDSDIVFEVHHDTFENVFANEIQSHKQPGFISDTYVVNENNSDNISNIPDMDPNRDKEEHDYVDYEQQHALFASLINNLNCDVEKWNKAMLKFEKETVSKQQTHREEVFINSSFEENVERIARNRLSEEFEPLVKYVNLQLNCFEKGLVKEMKDDLKYVTSLEDEFDETCLILDIQQYFFKTQFESVKLESHSHVYENKIFKQNSSLENKNCCLKTTITELSNQASDVKEEMTKRCAQYKKDFVNRRHIAFILNLNLKTNLRHPCKMVMF
ncbi:hypothetical protein Tco_0785039 [Tanacetum coccineum]